MDEQGSATSSPPHNGGGVELPPLPPPADDDHVALGFHQDRGEGEEEDEAYYEQELCEELENLVLESQREEQLVPVPDREEEYGYGYGEDERFGYGGGDDVAYEDDGARDEYYNGGGYGEGDGKYRRSSYNNSNNNNNYNGNGNGNGNSSCYPLRPDAEDCQFYVRNGSCKFGSSCKFNHPLRRRNQYPKAAKEKGDSGRPGQIECKYQFSSGGCKFGDACKYSHSGAKSQTTPAVHFNFLGLPIRPGETECPYYMRNGSCKYGRTCRFNHPDPTSGGDVPSASLQAASQTTIPSWSSPRALDGSAPMLPVVFSPTNGVPSNLEWNGYQASVYPAADGRLPTPPAFAMNNSTETSFYTHHKLPMLDDEFPERPGEPECSFFLKTGDCKYRSGCKFHHPKNRMPSAAPSALSDKGLPLRPGQKACSYYNRYGICKYGPACRYDHSLNYEDSSSSPLSRENEPSYFGNTRVAAGAGGKW